jgi:peptidoglycan/LPS O-acetylase OafA/YrhL
VSESAPRLVQLDALRGLAALAVVLFHYSTRFEQLYGHQPPLALGLPWGHYGVNLFFMISGFVIFLSLERSPRAMDFVVSRFSRLYPAYWGALALTFGLTHALGLPDRTVGWEVLLINASMLQEFVGVASVDAVYWTLAVELLFYAWSLLAHRWGGARGLVRLLLGLVGLRLVYVLAQLGWQLDLPWLLQRWLLQPHIAWFALGVAIYRHQHAGPQPGSSLLLLLALLCLALGEGLAVAGLGLCLLLWGAARRQWRWLEWRPLLWLGALSYPLYLLHEYIGWALMLALQRLGWAAPVGVAAALALSLLLAQGLHAGVELPGMRRLRQAYRQRQHSRPVLSRGG